MCVFLLGWFKYMASYHYLKANINWKHFYFNMHHILYFLLFVLGMSICLSMPLLIAHSCQCFKALVALVEILFSCRHKEPSNSNLVWNCFSQVCLLEGFSRLLCVATLLSICFHLTFLWEISPNDAQLWLSVWHQHRHDALAVYWSVFLCVLCSKLIIN